MWLNDAAWSDLDVLSLLLLPVQHLCFYVLMKQSNSLFFYAPFSWYLYYLMDLAECAQEG